MNVIGCAVCERDHKDLTVFEIPDDVERIVDGMPGKFRKFVICPYWGGIMFVTDNHIAENEGG